MFERDHRGYRRITRAVSWAMDAIDYGARSWSLRDSLVGSVVEEERDPTVPVRQIEVEIEVVVGIGVAVGIVDGVEVGMREEMQWGDRGQTTGALGVGDWCSRESMRVPPMARDISWIGTTEESMPMEGEAVAEGMATSGTVGIMAVDPMRFHL